MYGSAIALANGASSTLALVAPKSAGKLTRTLIARSGLLDRWRNAARVRDRSRPLVWFHAPSVGEGLQARPVIDALRATRPDVQIAYSFFSPSAEKFARSLNVDMVEYLPFDSASNARELLGIISPNALFFSKLDVWPNLVAAAKESAVITGMISGTVAPGSGRQGVFSRALLHDAYAALDVVGAIDAANGERLIDMGVRKERLSISGDTRFDQVWGRAESVDRNSSLLRALKSVRPTLVAGSTWPADEAVLLPAWNDVKAHVPNARIIVAVHEPTAAHLDSIAAWAKQSGLTHARLAEMGPRPTDAQTVNSAETNTRSGAVVTDVDLSRTSSNTSAGASIDVVIVDRVGVLGDIYAIADVAFVGGAFHKAGLHSVLEPAAYGVPVVFGPGYSMSREAGLLIQAEGARTVSTSAGCASVLNELLSDVELRGATGTNAKQFVQSELGAASRSLQLVVNGI